MKKRNKKLKEQALPARKPKGLPAPAELASKINSSGMGADEVMAWLGAVLSKASIGAAPSPEAASEPPPAPLPEPTPEAVQERLENKLLNSLLRDIDRSKRKKR